MSDIQVLTGGIYRDERGELVHMNGYNLAGAHRYYIIKHDNTEVIRGWHGHQFERKWFQCLKGAFHLAFVKVDRWAEPSFDLIPEKFHLTESKSELICLPRGYANCIRATEPDSILLVFSENELPEAELDSWRWPASMWGGDKL